MLAALLTIAGLHQATPPQTKLTYETVAVPIERALKEISVKTGLKLEASASLGKPVVVLRVEDAPIEKVLEKLAEVSSGEWTEADGVRRLVRDGARQAREAAEERRIRLEAVRKGIKQFVDGTLNPKAAAQGEVVALPGFSGASDSGSKAVARLLQLLDPSLLASDDPESRIVFSTAPTRTQLPIPGATAAIFADLVAEHNKAVLASQKDTAPKTAEMEELERWAKTFLGDRFDPKAVEERPVKALLISSGGLFGMGRNLELRLYGADGKVLLSSTKTLMSDQSELMQMAARVAGREPEPAPAKDDKAIEFSAATQQLSRIFSGAMRGEFPALGKELEEKLTRPDLHDPLSFAPSESLLFAGRHKKLQVVANLPDSIVSFFGMMAGGGSTTVEAFLKSLSGGETSAEVKDGWLTVRPAKPETARQKRADRSALAALIAASRAKGNASLDDVAAYSLRAEPPMESPIAMPYLTLFAPNALGQGMSGMTNWNMMRFYGTLGAGQRAALVESGGIPIRNLTPQQQALVRTLAFGSSARLRVRDASQPEEPGGFLALITQFLPGGSKDWREEPTEAMPNGLPMDGVVRMWAAQEIVGAPSGPSAVSRMMGVAGASEIALLRYLSEDPRMSQIAGGMMPRLDGLRLGARTSMRFRFDVAPTSYFEHTLNDDRVAKNAPVTPMDRLPAEFVAAVEKHLAEFKKNPIPFPTGGMRPPPF
jgi:hypothetical protein